MTFVDWSVVAVYFAMSLALGLWFARRAGRSAEEYFLSGRRLPWWLAGTAMVATTFAADTPLAVTELVARHGVAGNWLWWNMLLGGMLTTFFFARLWRRAGVLTDVELVELRYSGRPAAVLRGVRAAYLGVFVNAVVLGWVNLAMATVLEGMFGIPRGEVLFYLAGALAVTAAYAALAGLWGVAVTDAFQFVVAMVGTVALAIVVVGLPEVGGVAGLRAKLPASSFELFPSLGEPPAAGAVGEGLALSLLAFLAYVGVQWWATWYPGSEPGGGGYVAQRMMSAKDERHAFWATLWFQIAHYCVRPWPWILVGLAALVLYPDLGADERRLGYVWAMRDHLPVGLKGLLVAAFFAAYMSTVATHLNWGTSYVVHDLYHRFVRPQASERQLLRVSRLVTVGLMVIALVLTTVLETIAGAWVFLLEAGAGLGLVLILRWYWWRINAWSEIAAMITPLATLAVIRWLGAPAFPESLFVLVGVTTAVWLAVTVMTPPVDEARLLAFYRRVRPAWGWGPIAAQAPEVERQALWPLWRGFAAGVVLVLAALFGVGQIVLGDAQLGAGLLAVALGAAWVMRDQLVGTRG